MVDILTGKVVPFVVIVKNQKLYKQLEDETKSDAEMALLQEELKQTAIAN